MWVFLLVAKMGTNPLAIPANNIICSLTDPEGRSLGAPLDLPQDAGPKELYLLINTLLQNVSEREVLVGYRFSLMG